MMIIIVYIAKRLLYKSCLYYLQIRKIVFLWSEYYRIEKYGKPYFEFQILNLKFGTILEYVYVPSLGLLNLNLAQAASLPVESPGGPRLEHIFLVDLISNICHHHRRKIEMAQFGAFHIFLLICIGYIFCMVLLWAA